MNVPVPTLGGSYGATPRKQRSLRMSGGASADDGFVQSDSSGGSEEWGVECEHTTVGGDQPVATGHAVCSYADDRFVQSDSSGGALEDGLESEDAAVRGDQPVATGHAVCGYADDRFVQCDTSGGAVVVGARPEGKHPSI